MSVPKKVRDEVRERLWAAADELQWERLNASVKSKHYKQWAESEEIGRRLADHMDPRAVRVYIKDTLLKPYTRSRLEQHRDTVLRIAKAEVSEITAAHIKPHAVATSAGALLSWGKADDWKVVLTSAFERGYGANINRQVVVLFDAGARFQSPSSRRVVEEVAHRFGFEAVHWVQ